MVENVCLVLGVGEWVGGKDIGSVVENVCVSGR